MCQPVIDRAANMILWDRVKRSLDGGLEQIIRVSRAMSERARIEATVARLMIEKGGLETKLDRLYRQLGEQTTLLMEQQDRVGVGDQEVAESLQGITELRQQISELRNRIQKVSMGERED